MPPVVNTISAAKSSDSRVSRISRRLSPTLTSFFSLIPILGNWSPKYAELVSISSPIRISVPMVIITASTGSPFSASYGRE